MSRDTILVSIHIPDLEQLYIHRNMHKVHTYFCETERDKDATMVTHLSDRSLHFLKQMKKTEKQAGMNHNIFTYC